MKIKESVDSGWILYPVPDQQPMEKAVADAAAGLLENGLSCDVPEQVHSILIRNEVIDDPLCSLDCSAANWVSERSWIYSTVLSTDERQRKGKQLLQFEGLDTIVDIFLNGKHLASHRDMFLPLEIDISGRLKGEDTLVLYFHSPWGYIREYPMLPEWRGLVPQRQTIRKGPHDFCEFNGPKPYLTPVGIFGDVYLESVAGGELSEVSAEYRLDVDLGQAQLSTRIVPDVPVENLKLLYRLLDPQNKVLESRTILLDRNTPEIRIDHAIEEVQLWWPRGYGEQPLYTVLLELVEADLVHDRWERQIGFRSLEMSTEFDLKINGRQIRMYGGNLTPLDNHTHVYDPGRMDALLDLAEECNFNILRAWGGGEPYPDDFYRQADQRGILVWVDFFHRWDRYPDDEDFRNLCRAEATWMVSSLKHHPSICLWCGGNESYLGREVEEDTAEPFIGGEIFEEDYREICNRLDPGRLYIPNSPCWGEYSNDPLKGDTHGYTHIWFNRQAEFPLLLSENCRVSVPNIRTMKNYFSGIEGDFWPEGYSSIRRTYDEVPLPELWRKILGADALYERFAVLENFYDADSPENLIYAFGAAHGRHLRDTVEAIRRGRPSTDSDGPRRSRGHLVWKFNDSWPLIFSGVVDYNLGNYIPYFALKRAYTPVIISFEKGDSIHLWVVNDSPESIKGEVVFSLFNTKTNAIVEERRFGELKIASDASTLIGNLDSLAPFHRHFVLFAEFIDSNGRSIAEAYEFMATERRIEFPDSVLSMAIDDGDIIIETDKYAHSVELVGDNKGNQFGWRFSDNYFSLIPGRKKRIRITGGHSSGLITAKPHYSQKSVTIEWCRY